MSWRMGDGPKMDEAPESLMTQRLSNRLSVSMLPDARNPEYAFAGPAIILAEKSRRRVKTREEFRKKAGKNDDP